jgi:hypothetical protein
MKLAIISTTIHGEKGYLPYDAHLIKHSKFKDVRFFIAGDKKSPPFNVSDFECPVDYITPEMQEVYACSELIGWGKPARRNIALLRAIESKPDFILTIDDDNIPDEDYFDLWYKVVTSPVNKIVVPIKEIEHEHWHNYLKATDAEFEMHPRGFPIPFRHKYSTEVKKSEKDIHAHEIGIFQGVSLGDPDIDAKTRIVYPKPTPLNIIHEKNYVLRHIWSPYNSQNTMFAKKLFPLAFMWPGGGRSEDIYASYVWQRFLFNNDMYAHVGDPVNRQVRGKRDDIRDLALEVESYIHGHHLWTEINKIKEKDALLFIEELTRIPHAIAERERDFMNAFLKDLKRIL